MTTEERSMKTIERRRTPLRRVATALAGGTLALALAAPAAARDDPWGAGYHHDRGRVVHVYHHDHHDGRDHRDRHHRGKRHRKHYRNHHRKHRRRVRKVVHVHHYAPVVERRVVVERPVVLAPAPAPAHPAPDAAGYGRPGISPGGIMGAAFGGLAGAQIGGGRGRLAATAAGTLGGYLIGDHVTRRH
jgi:hypothetical protein